MTSKITVGVIVSLIALALFAIGGSLHQRENLAVGAPTSQSTRDLIPFTDSVYYIGTTSKAYRQIYVDEVCLSGDSCETTWPVGGGGGGGDSLWQYTGGSDTLTPRVASTSNNALLRVSRITATSTTATNTLPWLTSTNLAVTGKLYAAGSPGANGRVLRATGSGINWTATSSLYTGDFTIFGNKLGTTSINSLSKLETITGVSNILIENDIDASSELAALMDDETGTAGSLVFSAGPTLTGVTRFATASGTHATTSTLTVTGLTSALTLTGANGAFAEYAGTSCTNQFVRSLSALGAATCATVANTDLANSTVSYGGVSLSLGGTDATPAFNLTDATSLPISTGVSGLGSNVATFLATPSSANFGSAVTGETGSGAVVFDTAPTMSSTTITGRTKLTLASTTALTATRAYLTQLANLTGNGFVKTSGSNGTLSIDTNTYLTGIGSLSIDALSDVDTTGAASGTILMFNGSTWLDKATSTLGYSWNNLRNIPAGFADGVDNTGSGGAGAWATSSAGANTILFPAVSTWDVLMGANSTATAGFWYDDSATTTYIGNGGAGDADISFGPTGYRWTIGFDDSDDSFAIASSSVLGTTNAFTIAKSTLATTLAGNLTINGQLGGVSSVDATTESTIEAAIDTLANLTSAAALATIGTITSGTWQGSVIGTSYGGTGSSTDFFRDEGSAIYASSTLDADGLYGPSGTTTYTLANYKSAVTLTALYCKTDTGSVSVQIGNGSATSTARCTTSGVESTTLVPFTSRANYRIRIGSQSGNPNLITVTDTRRHRP